MIKFIRQYKFYGSDWFDIVYTDGKYITRVRTCLLQDLPKTAQRYIEKATPRVQERNRNGHGVFCGEGKTETIYEVKESNR